MAEIVKTKPAIKKTNAKPIGKKTAAVKSIAKAASTTTTAATAAVAADTTAETEKPKLTQGQKLLKSMTAQKAAKKALMKGVAVTHVSFDDEGNEANVETVIQKTAPPAKVVNPKKTNKNRPAVKKPEPMKKKKRSADEMETEEEQEKSKDDVSKEEEQKDDEKKDNKKPPKKAKKPKKTKVEIEELKKDNKQEEALAYVRLFVNDRDAWKFKKVQQIWLLSNLYEIPEDEFDNVLEYLKDLQGSAREKTKQEAKDKLPVKKVETPVAAVSNTLTGYANVNTGNDDDDFDAEKLLAQASAAPVVQEQVVEEEEEKSDDEEEEEEESAEVKRAKLIIEMLS